MDRIGVRVPPFYPAKPSLWFAALESQFALANITLDSTKYNHIISQLDPAYADIVEDVITGPAATDKYERLKSELIKRLTASREKQVMQLLHHEELGDRKPSQFLRHLKTLAGPGVPDSFVKTVWSSHLPLNVQTIVASQFSKTLEESAELADQIMDIVSSSPQVAAAGRSGTSDDSQVSAITKRLDAMDAKLDRLSRPKARRPASANRRGRSASHRSQSSYRKHPTCWYHFKFGAKANKCVKPCDFTGKA